jgi:hypothetical protein
MLISVAPQIKHWGATTQLRDTVTLLKAKIEALAREDDDAGMVSHCLIIGRPDRYLERMFDHVHQADSVRFPPALEILLVPDTIVAVSVHALIGASTGLAAPLGLASFDKDVILSTQKYLLQNLDSYVRDGEARSAISDRCSVEGLGQGG